MRRALVTALLLSTLTAPALVLAQPGAPGDGQSRHHSFQQRFQQELGLTDDQMKAIQEIQKRQRDAARPLWQALTAAQTELRQLALGGGDEAAIRAKVTEIEHLYGQAQQLRVDALREIAPLLNDEQRQKLAQMGPRQWHRRPSRAPQG